MGALNWGRLGREVLLGVLALACALVVMLPGLVVVNLLYNAGLYTLLTAIAAFGILLLAYQARLRPSLREPALRAAAGIAEVLRGADEEAPSRTAAAAFRTWSGVPIAALRVSVHSSPDATPTRLAEALCSLVRTRVAATSTLTWALSEVGGSRFLLLREPSSAAAPPPLDGAVAASRQAEITFHHLWSANGPASYEEPVAFALVLMGQAVAGREPDLHSFAVHAAERVARLPDIAGVEVLTAEPGDGGPPYFLWLAAGRTRAVRRQVYLALEPSSATQGLAWSVERYDLLACDAYATLHEPAQPVLRERPAGGHLGR